jgi:hypothetical protein
MSYAYYEKTGYKFTGSEMEFQNRYPVCNKETNFVPWSDEENYFSYFLCLKDYKTCRHDCKNHKECKCNTRELNEDIREFFEATCERYRK